MFLQDSSVNPCTLIDSSSYYVVVQSQLTLFIEHPWKIAHNVCIQWFAMSWTKTIHGDFLKVYILSPVSDFMILKLYLILSTLPYQVE